MADSATQRSYTAPCPGCGAPVEFKSAQSIYAVCPYCQSTVVRDGDTLHISGVPCRGADMHVAVRDCYGKLTKILQQFDADSSQVVKETVFTTDMDGLIKAIPDRKTFFADGKYPAASWVQISRLFDAEAKLEVEWTVRLK